MRNIRLVIEYDGTGYSGWQVQRNQKQKTSVQEKLEKTLQSILQEKVRIISSGRTDAGVHALGQVANFRTTSSIPLNKLRQAMNALLPEDIAVVKVKEEGPDFHSRFNAKSKIYRYVILNRSCRSPFLRNRVYFYPHPLDIKLMQKEARVLVGRHDFTSFCGSLNLRKNPVRTVKRIKVKKDGNLVLVEIEAGGFLYNMARNIVGTLIEIGRGKLGRGDLKRILLARDRRLAGPTAAAAGLFLVKVNY